jgi:hypothetical protein
MPHLPHAHSWGIELYIQFSLQLSALHKLQFQATSDQKQVYHPYEIILHTRNIYKTGRPSPNIC